MTKPKNIRRWREIVNGLGERGITLTNIVLEEKGQGLQDFFNEKEITYKEAVVLRQYAKAIITGDVRSAEFLRDTSGEKPTTEISVQDSRSPLHDMSTEDLNELLDFYRKESNKNG